MVFHGVSMSMTVLDYKYIFGGKDQHLNLFDGILQSITIVYTMCIFVITIDYNKGYSMDLKSNLLWVVT